MLSNPEIPLHGGNVTSGVVRIGDTVRKPAGPASATVHAFLEHLEAVGFDHAPRSLGFDERGRHVLEYVEGDVAMPYGPSQPDEELSEVGRIVRALHDASQDFVPPRDAHWNVAISPDREELTIHHDAGPWNLVRGDGRLVLIDWDGAGPGSRLWDLSYACLGFVPLARDVDIGIASRRLSQLVDGYGLDDSGRRELPEMLIRRAMSMYELLRDGASSGEQPWSRLWHDGHGATWRGFAHYVERNARAVRAALE